MELATHQRFLARCHRRFIIFNPEDDLLSFFTNAGNGQRVNTVDGERVISRSLRPYERFDPDQIVLTNFIAALAGDYNQNGVVDAADYAVWRDHFGQTFTLAGENPTTATPGLVDQEDYDFWRARFGLIAGSGSGAGRMPPYPNRQPWY